MINRIHAAENCLQAAKLLYSRGLVNAYEGNVSVRVGASLFITPAAVCKELLTPEDLVEVALDTGAVLRAAKGRAPSSELNLHLCCYRCRPDIQAVAHAHPPYATSFALRCEPIETRGYPELMARYGRVPVCRYGRIGTDAMTADVPAALENGDALLLANHGLAAVAGDAMTAAYRLEGIESIAKALHLTRLRGGESPLPPEEVAEIERLRLSKG